MALPGAQFPYVARRRFDVLRSDGPPIHRRAQHAHVIKEWEVSWPLLTDSQAADIRTENASSRGGAGTFTWTNPDGASVTAWFLAPLELQRIAYNWWSGQAVIREEFI